MTPAESLVASAMTERRLQTLVIDLARTLGYEPPYHTRDSRGSEPGFPDLVLLRLPKAGRPGRVLYAELKAQRGTVSAAQQSWLDRLRACGQETYCWRPSDWLSGRIQEALG